MSEMGDYWGRETLVRLEGEPNIVKAVSGIVDDAVAANAPAAKLSNLERAVIDAAKTWYHAEFVKTAAERDLVDELNVPLELAEAIARLVASEKIPCN